jgi:hypothetical protein
VPADTCVSASVSVCHLDAHLAHCFPTHMPPCPTSVTSDLIQSRRQVETQSKESEVLQDTVASLRSQVKEQRGKVKALTSDLAQSRRAHQMDVVNSAEDAAAIAKKLRAEVQSVAANAERVKAKALADLEARLNDDFAAKLRYVRRRHVLRMRCRGHVDADV